MKVLDLIIPYSTRRQLIKKLDRAKNNLFGVRCSVCNQTFEKFLPFGEPKRENAQCPSCKSLERHRLIFLFLKEKKLLLSPNKKIKLLHFAPEPCFFQVFKDIKMMDYIPCDLSPEIYSYPRGPEVNKIDITSIPLKDNSIDFILCNHVLEHVLDDAKALKELCRVLKPGGHAILLVPIIGGRKVTFEDESIVSPEERLEAFGQEDHVRHCGEDYLERYSTAGFRVNSDYGAQFPKRQRAKYGLLEEERIYFCSK